MKLVEYANKKTVVTWLVDDIGDPQRIMVNDRSSGRYGVKSKRDKFVSRYGENIIKNCQPVFVAEIALVDTSGSNNRDGFLVLDTDTGEKYEMRIEEGLGVLNNCELTGKTCRYISDWDERRGKEPKEYRIFRALITFNKIGSNGFFMCLVDDGKVPDELPDTPTPFPDFF